MESAGGPSNKAAGVECAAVVRGGLDILSCQPRTELGLVLFSVNHANTSVGRSDYLDLLFFSLLLQWLDQTAAR